LHLWLELANWRKKYQLRNYKYILGASSLLITFIISYLYWDRPVALWCKEYCVGSYNDFFAAITKLGVSTPYLIGSALLFLYFYYAKRNLRHSYHALFLFSTVALSGIVADIIKVIAGRFRPSMLFDHGLYGFDLFHIKSAMTSFPSGHTATAFALAMYISLYWPKWALAGWIMAVAIGLSRIMTTAHYLSDVIAGIAVGILSVKVLVHYWPKKWAFND
jgi:membrane-associated phospholipid phosphatase